jgi:hypothetical protein
MSSCARSSQQRQRGCDVRLLYDRWGSPNISEEHAARLSDAGVKSSDVQSRSLPNKKLGRKIGAHWSTAIIARFMITDGTGYTGGRNISTDYGGPGPGRLFRRYPSVSKVQRPATSPPSSSTHGTTRPARHCSKSRLASEAFGDGISTSTCWSSTARRGIMTWTARFTECPAPGTLAMSAGHALFRTTEVVPIRAHRRHRARCGRTAPDRREE